MIIKMIPETDEERKRYAQKGVSEVEHRGVREFMIFGNKIDSEGDLADFHEWHGSYRYLMGSLNYFYESINDNRRNQGGSAQPQLSLAESPTGMIKRGGIMPNLQTLDLSKLRQDDEEAGAFDDEEARAVDFDDVQINVEDLGEEPQEQEEPRPQGLRLVKD